MSARDDGVEDVAAILGRAAACAGFTHAFNVLEGFEGDADERRQRGHRGGWRKANLPWIQD